jgi:hypothetical protein
MSPFGCVEGLKEKSLFNFREEGKNTFCEILFRENFRIAKDFVLQTFSLKVSVFANFFAKRFSVCKYFRENLRFR